MKNRFGTLLQHFAAPALSLALAGCGDDFAPGSRVTDFRVLAVQADLPYAAPGEQVHLRALWHEPFGRRVSFGWLSCDKPPDTSAVGCLHKVFEDAAKSGQPPAMQTGDALDQIDTTVPSGIFDGVPSDARGNTLVGVVTVACPGTLSLLDPAGLGTGELPFRCEEDGTGAVLPFERYAVSVKRIFVREKDRNANPAIAQVYWDGVAWPEGEVKQTRPCANNPNHIDDCDGGERHRLSVSLVPGAEESGTDELGHQFHEKVVLQYYATEGTFEFDVRTAESPVNHWAARKLASGRTLTLWFVARDSRGGVSWTSRDVDVL